MQKQILFALTRRGLLALLGLSVGSLVEPTLAGVYQASTDVSLFDEAGGTVGNGFLLPKYSGPGSITGVTLTLSGSAEGSVFWNYFVEDGITVAPFGETWDFLVAGPPVVSGGGVVLQVPTSVNYPGLSVPPCTECGEGSAEVDTPPVSATFSGSVDLTDPSDFAGSGSNDFVFAINVELTETISASGTVTETIFTSVPEPSTWGMMLAGFAGLGWLTHMQRRITA